jgi:hypothetical protein
MLCKELTRDVQGSHWEVSRSPGDQKSARIIRHRVLRSGSGREVSSHQCKQQVPAKRCRTAAIRMLLLTHFVRADISRGRKLGLHYRVGGKGCLPNGNSIDTHSGPDHVFRRWSARPRTISDSFSRARRLTLAARDPGIPGSHPRREESRGSKRFSVFWGHRLNVA